MSNLKTVWIFINNLGLVWFGLPQILQFSSEKEFGEWCAFRDVDITIRAVYYDPD